MDLGRTFTRSMAWTAGRIIMGLILAGGIAYFGTGKAHAGALGCPSGNATCDDGTARQLAYKAAKSYFASLTNTNGRRVYYALRFSGNPSTSTNTYWEARTCLIDGMYPPPTQPQQNDATGCSAGTIGMAPDGKYYFSGTCASRAPLVGLYPTNFATGSVLCNFGCQFVQSQKKSDTTIENADKTLSLRYGIISGATPNGLTCSNPEAKDEPEKEGEKPPECLKIGTDSAGDILHCPKEDGGSCTVSGKGTKFCQPPPPNSEGPKVDSGRTEGNSQSTSPNNAPQAPAPRPGESFAPGPSSTVCNNVTGACVQSNVYSNTGTPNPNGATVPGDGSKNGTGQQEGTGATGGGTAAGEGTDMGPTNAKLDGIKGDTGGMLSALNGIKDWWDGLGSEAGGLNEGQGEDKSADDSWAPEDTDPGDLDQGGFGYGSSCPTPPQINVPGGGQLDWSLLCTLAQYFGTLILAGGFVQAAYIIGRA